MRPALLTLALALTFAACAPTPTLVDPEPIDTLDDLVETLRGGGYYLEALSTALYQTTPQPVAVYEVTQPDGEVLRVLAYDPAEIGLIRADLNRERPRTGLTSGREYNVEYRPRRRVENRPQLFLRGDVLVVFPHSPQHDLYHDLRLLLGDPQY